MTEVLPGRSFVVKNLSDLGIGTLKDAITSGINGLSKAKGLGSCSIDEIEIAALQEGVSIFTKNKAVISFIVERLLPGLPINSRKLFSERVEVSQFDLRNLFKRLAVPIPPGAFSFSILITNKKATAILFVIGII